MKVKRLHSNLIDVYGWLELGDIQRGRSLSRMQQAGTKNSTRRALVGADITSTDTLLLCAGEVRQGMR